jgi:hypothetical protein
MSGPRVFGLPHLSEDAVAAFADGVLSAAAASRAQRHCAECAECADAVRGQREAAMMLRAAQAPSLPSGLLDRLAGLPMSAPLPPPRGGLPTVVGADGTAMFVAHDPRKTGDADRSAERHHTDSAAPRPAAAPHRQQHRRGALPVTVLASAAAVVAAGTFGGHVSTLAAANRQAPSGAANAAGALTGGQLSPVRSASPLGGTASVLSVSHSDTLAASSGSGGAATAGVSGGVLSVTVGPLGRAPRQPDAPQPGARQAGAPQSGARQPGTAPRQPGTAAAPGSAQGPARHGTWSFTALAAMMAGAPTATP